ncbi:vif protein [Jembrana disease virus]|uniref:Virion infectivity factor n=1 Tax=Jembrana disease virus TaxID=36370 RepID=VIF_JEMBR|nr:vif protein [Jembrana disease virus]Q82852.1 RecName: Full=Virion infectivity factor; Short=Vif [Jembrana disease virus]AAA64391.1 vif protein [Jembrana disease virus]prf//2116345C vif gene [Jembrana disease virus]
MERTIQSPMGRRRGSSGRRKRNANIISPPAYAIYPAPQYRYPRWEFVMNDLYSQTARLQKEEIIITYRYAVWAREWKIQTGFLDLGYLMTPAGTHTTGELNELDLFWVRYTLCQHRSPKWRELLLGEMTHTSCRRTAQAAVVSHTKPHTLQRLAGLTLVCNQNLCWYPVGTVTRNSPLWMHFTTGKEPTIQQLSGHP